VSVVVVERDKVVLTCDKNHFTCFNGVCRIVDNFVVNIAEGAGY